ncbi:MAG: mismatch repair protein MutS2 [Bacteroidales bacterium]|nr:mismatch repair protein MutS2 [Bacteroidales bacterium]
MLYPENFENKIGFDRIREMLKGGCLSNLGRNRVDKIRFSKNYTFIQTLVSQVDEFKQIMAMEEDFPLNHFFDVTAAINKIRVEGTYLLPEELFDLKRSLETIRAILKFFKARKEEEKYPYLQRLTENVKLYPFIFERIDGIITKDGKIKDNASPELGTIRKEISHKESTVSKRLYAILKEAQKSGIVEQDISLSIRDGRATIPVDASNKRRIKGLILDESATGKTAYIEPTEIVELNNDIRELYYAEKREIIKILTSFANDVRPYCDDLLLAYEFMGTIDFIRSKALLANKLHGIKPVFVNRPYLQWKQAIHPLLFLSFKDENRKVVPLDIELNNDNQRILLISGPNAGGKSVCLQTVGLLQYMFQCGLLVPMHENSEIGIFQHLFINIGDDQSIENDLSTYSSHLMNMKYFIKSSNQKTLLLIDEFGSGTEPMLGGAIAESILDALNQKKTFGVITTHYTNLKHFASSTQGIENGAMLFDTDKIQPLFKLSIGEPGSSFAFEIARKIGLPEDILQSATAKIGKDHINFDKNLKDIIRDKRYWESKRESVRKSEKKLEQLIAHYSSELEDAEKSRKEVLKKAKEEAQQMLAEVNKRIENTIREIRESQAEKEKTKKARKQLADYKEYIESIDSHDDEKIQRKIEKLKNREKRKNEQKHPVEENQKAEPKPDIFEKGDKVRLYGQETVGEVLDVNGHSIMVAFGNMITTLDKKRLDKISEKQYRQLAGNEGQASSTKWDFGEKRLNFKPEIDVRGKRADEALQAVRDFIDEALVINIGTVKILHGKGDGILRQLIRQYLETVDLVKNYHDESVQFGGSGITIVEFE